MVMVFGWQLRPLSAIFKTLIQKVFKLISDIIKLKVLCLPLMNKSLLIIFNPVILTYEMIHLLTVGGIDNIMVSAMVERLNTA